MNSASRTTRAARLVVQACAVAAGGGSLALAVGWLCGQWSFATFGERYVPMAPSTAWLFILMSAALLVHNRWPQRRLSQIVGGVAVGVVGLVGTLVITRQGSPRVLDMEAWLASASGTISDIPVGRMSPHTAMTFLCVGGALGCLWGVLSCPRWWRPLAFVLAALVFGSGTVAILGYASDAPLLYGSGHIPMALATAAAFAVLGLGLMVAAYPENWLLRGLTGDGADDDDGADQAGSRWFGAILVTAFMATAVGICTMGFFQLRRHLAESHLLAQETLSAVADLKVARIADWRRERMADGDLVCRTPYAARRALDVLGQPDSRRNWGMFTAWLDRLRAVGPYEQVLLLDAEFKVQLAHPRRDARELSGAARRAAEQAFRTREVVMSDLDLTTAVGHSQLSIAVPLVVRQEGDRENVPAAGTVSTSVDRSAAVLILQVNADEALFPFVNLWPTPSDTAEILLLRREGDAVAYLNRLPRTGEHPVGLPAPVSRKEALMVRATQGPDRLLDGVDYLGVPVLAARRAIDGTPWVLVAKVDQEEIFAPIHRQAQSDSIITVGLVFGGALGLGQLWRQRVAELLRRQLAAERDQRTLAERIVYLTKHASDIILLSDENLRIIEANDRALEVYGYTAEEIQQRTLRDLRAPNALPGLDLVLPQASSPRGLVFETMHRRNDGTILPVEVSARVINVEGRRIAQEIIRDITERKRTEETIQASLQEKETMLKEIHHRVKNNLQIIVSLLNLQAGRVQDAAVLDSLRTTQARVYSMALLHEMLYGSQNLAHVNIASYIARLCAHVRQACGTDGGLIDVEPHADGVQLGLEQAVPCGLIITELVANALKHAFPDGRSGKVLVELRPGPDGKIVLRVRDDGAGLPAGLDVSAATSTLGLRLVSALAGQLAGRLMNEEPASGGAAFRVEFPCPKETLLGSES